MWPPCDSIGLIFIYIYLMCAVVPRTFEWVVRLQPTSHYMVYTLTKIMAPPPSTGLSWQSQTTVTSQAPTRSRSNTSKVGTAHSKWALTFCSAAVAVVSLMAAVHSLLIEATSCWSVIFWETPTLYCTMKLAHFVTISETLAKLLSSRITLAKLLSNRITITLAKLLSSSKIHLIPQCHTSVRVS